MQEVSSTSEEILKDLEQYALPLNLVEHGFTYTRDDDRDDLDDSTIFNSLLKTKRFRGLEIKKEWIKISIAEKNGAYYLLTYDVRRDDEYNPYVLKLMSPVDNIIIDHIRHILNPDKLNSENSLKQLLKEITIKNFVSVGASEEKIKVSPIDGLIKVSGLIMRPFEIVISFDKKKNEVNDKHMVVLKVIAENGESYYSKLLYVNNIQELDPLMQQESTPLSDKLKELLNNVSYEELIVKKTQPENVQDNTTNNQRVPIDSSSKSFEIEKKQSSKDDEGTSSISELDKDILGTFRNLGKSFLRKKSKRAIEIDKKDEQPENSNGNMIEFIISTHATSGFFAGKKHQIIKKFESLEAAEKYKDETNSDPKNPIKIIDIKEKS